jgi:hypothetical protein
MTDTEVSQLMAKTGLKVMEIAAALDIPVATLNRYKRGATTMPDEKLEELRKLAGGSKPLQLVGKRPTVPAKVLAEVPDDALIQELARRSRGGILGRNNRPAGNLDTPRPLRAVAFRDTEDDDE